MRVTSTEKKQVQDIYDGLLGFLKMLSTSPEFRRHILDLTNILQDIFVRSTYLALNGISFVDSILNLFNCSWNRQVRRLSFPKHCRDDHRLAYVYWLGRIPLHWNSFQALHSRLI